MSAESECVVTISTDGQPTRNAAMIERDRGVVSVAAHKLKGTSNRGRGRTTPPFTVAELLAAASSESTSLRQSAAILGGRCRAPDSTGEAALVETLDRLSGTSEEAVVRVEAAMSCVLRGHEVDRARSTLASLAAGPNSDEPWRAAAYLAQLGDAQGWPAVIAAVAATSPQHHRVTALDAAAAFAPLQGTTVDTFTVDVHGLIAGLARDEAIGVRQNVPRLLVDIGHPDARTIIATMAESDPSDGVRAVASATLRGL